MMLSTSQAEGRVLTSTTYTPGQMVHRFWTLGVLLEDVVQPIIATRPRVRLAVSVDKQRRMDRF